MLILGEVGLTGEVRAVGHVDIRAMEAAKMGFKRCLVPQGNIRRLGTVPGITTIGVKTVEDALEQLF
jgi:DNA repair protein RadA/Sms